MTQLQSVTSHTGSHSVTCQPTQVNTPPLTPASQAGTRFTCPGGKVDLGDCYILRWFTRPQTVTHLSTVVKFS